MSGVYARNRNLSSFEFFTAAVRVRTEVTRLVTSGAVPKSYRFVLAVPMAETARGVVANLVRADAFFPSSEEAVAERKRCMTLAVAGLDMLYQDVQLLLSLGLPVRASRFEDLCNGISEAVRLIKGARSGVRLVRREG